MSKLIICTVDGKELHRQEWPEEEQQAVIDQWLDTLTMADNLPFRVPLKNAGAWVFNATHIVSMRIEPDDDDKQF